MKRSGLKPRSKKMTQLYRQRRKLVSRLLQEKPVCEARVDDVCTGKSVDLHEVLARSQGGSILDESNIICVCRACHDFIGREVKQATEMGLRRRRYDQEK